jgi:hypothetical protein
MFNRPLLRSILLGTVSSLAAILIAGCASSGPSGGPGIGAVPALGPGALSRHPSPLGSFKFRTINNNTDPTFNQLLGINDGGEISGYYGSGLKGHPNKGYTVVSPYGQKNFTAENYPGSVQTQVTGLNNLGYTCGFWVDSKGVNRGFIEWNGVFTSYVNPNTGTGTVNQLLGINDSGIAVGFYMNAKGVSFGYTLDRNVKKFSTVTPPGATNVVVTGINDAGNLVGFYGKASASVGFIRHGKQFSTFMYPKSTATMAFGINAYDQIVGAYVDSKNKMHGFLLNHPIAKPSWVSIDDPAGVGTTTINGLNDLDDMVGFYVDSKGNTDGMLITP